MHSCTNVPYTEEILQAFHIATKKDNPEIHPPGFMLLKSRHLTSAQWSHMTVPWTFSWLAYQLVFFI